MHLQPRPALIGPDEKVFTKGLYVMGNKDEPASAPGPMRADSGYGAAALIARTGWCLTRHHCQAARWPEVRGLVDALGAGRGPSALGRSAPISSRGDHRGTEGQD